MNVDENSDVAVQSDRALARIAEELERRRPGATVASVGVRPHRRPWTYRDIVRLEAVRTELERRRVG